MADDTRPTRSKYPGGGKRYEGTVRIRDRKPVGDWTFFAEDGSVIARADFTNHMTPFPTAQQDFEGGWDFNAAMLERARFWQACEGLETPPLFKGLDDIDWATVGTPYSKRFSPDLPYLIRGLATDALREQAFDQLTHLIEHQGSTYQSTALSIPFLLRLLSQSDLDRRFRLKLLFWLPGLAAAWSYDQLVEFNEFYERLDEEVPADGPEPDWYWEKRALDTVAAASELFGRLLVDDDPELRRRAAAILTAAPGDRAATAALFLERCAIESDPMTHAAMIIGLAQLMEGEPRAPLVEMMEDEDALVRFCAALTLVRLSTDHPTARSLLEAVREDPSLAPQAYEELFYGGDAETDADIALSECSK